MSGSIRAMLHVRTAFAFTFAGLLLGTSGCRRLPLLRHRPHAHHFTRGPQPLKALNQANSTEQLPLAHFEAATVSVPLGAHWARPIVIALHAEGDSANASCAAWSAIMHGDYFVLCPALIGKLSAGKSLRCDSVDCLADELREALIALKERFGRYVARKEVVLAARGSAAARAAPIALQNPAVFSVVWLVDGGMTEWASALSVAYAQRGGKFLGLVCGDSHCESEALRVGTSARTASLSTAIVRTGPLGTQWSSTTVVAVGNSWQKSKPAGWPWSVPRRL